MTIEEHLDALKPLIQLPEGVKWGDIVAKYYQGAISHAGEPHLWQLPDWILKKEIKQERIDLLIYEAEARRRQNADH